MEAKELKTGQYIVYNNEPYQVRKKEVVVYGTHSHSKLKLFLKPALGTGEKIINFAHTDNVETLEIIKKKGTIISLSGKQAQIMDSVSYETFDATIHDEVTEELQEGQDATFIELKGERFIIDGR